VSFAAAVALLAVAALAVAVTFVVARREDDGDASAVRRDLQAILDDLVSGADRVAPGATAFVVGPQETWAGAAGLADLGAEAPMTPDARMRMESVSKLWTATLILQLDQEDVLSVDDTVEHWLPGLLPDGDQITIRNLLTNSSGLIDDNDAYQSEAAFATYLANVKDPELRARIIATADRVADDPSVEVPPMLLIELAAWQPLLFAPGTQQHHSNIGFNLAGIIAEKASGDDLATLFGERLFHPLGLRNTAYDPQGPISGPHANGYRKDDDGHLIDATNDHLGKGADGGIVSDAADTATFLTRLMRGEILDGEHLTALKEDAFWNGGWNSGGCAGTVFDAVGAGDGYRAQVYVDGDGARAVVLLLNGRSSSIPVDEAVTAASLQLYCAA
jgi:D-alanyl-D-alanine carboxypeptidase